jgi:hypothetical protein
MYLRDSLWFASGWLVTVCRACDVALHRFERELEQAVAREQAEAGRAS